MWGTVRASFERALSDPVVTVAGIASEHRTGADYVRLTMALVVTAKSVNVDALLGLDFEHPFVYAAIMQVWDNTFVRKSAARLEG